MSLSPPARDYTLITGATGFVGLEVLAELLKRSYFCAILLRRPVAPRIVRLRALLADYELDLDALLGSGRLVTIAGALPDDLPGALDFQIERVVHAAASTRFDEGCDREPTRTNDEGVRRLLEWMDRIRVTEFHLISTAFVCGRTREPAPEVVASSAPPSQNAYEHSKWKGERHAVAWAERAGVSSTIYRPSIVVGDAESGRATRFSGLYLMFRACDILSRSLRDDVDDRQNVPLRIGCRGSDPINIIPVDYLARLTADIIGCKRRHGAVYNIVHPDPPTNNMIRSTIERYFGIAGGQFVDPEDLEGADLNTIERSFLAAIRPLLPYLADSPAFSRANTVAAEEQFNRRCPAWEEESLSRLIDYARASNWGRQRSSKRSDAGEMYAAYFEEYLPARVATSRIAQLASLTTTVRFVISDLPNGEWVCCFERGQLTHVQRGSNGIHEDFAYHTCTSGFWEVVGARSDPQQVFLSGRADMTGDIEQALKMGVILRDFNREHPCSPDALRAHIGARSLG